MTHEERARHIVEKWTGWIGYEGLADDVVDALRTVELEAYERAAKLCEQYRHDAHTFGAVPADPMLAMSVAAHEISSAIRELAKAKDSP